MPHDWQFRLARADSMRCSPPLMRCAYTRKVPVASAPRCEQGQPAVRPPDAVFASTLPPVGALPPDGIEPGNQRGLEFPLSMSDMINQRSAGDFFSVRVNLPTSGSPLLRENPPMMYPTDPSVA